MLVPNSTIVQTVKLALREDVGGGDLTAALIPSNYTTQAKITTRQNMVLCGVDWVNTAFQQLDPKINLQWNYYDGDVINANSNLCTIAGNSRNILTAERVALNFLQTLSATATITNQFAKLLTTAKLLDTRKTIPNLRLAQKYAVAVGGGNNHRLGLYDAYLIKENHIAACGSIKNAVATARKLNPEHNIEVEIENLTQLHQVLATNCNRIMLDNFSISNIKHAVIINQNQCELEVSGNINLDNIAEYDKTGVNFISVGALTKNIFAIDLSLQFL